ncbi:MAG: hypothetical protein AABW65_01890 [Nanoarchaeota archaeon]
MNLELKLIPQFEQVFYIPEYEVGRVLEAASPFKKDFPAKDDMIVYLTHVNGSLKERNEQHNMLRNKYITAASIYSCVRPIIHLHLPEKVEEVFTKIAKTHPYYVEKPLQLVFTKSDEDTNKAIIESIFQAQLADINETLSLDTEAKFSRSEFIKERLIKGVEDIAHSLNCKYNEREHLLFTSLWNICFPLFGIARNNTMHKSVEAHLQNNYGHIHLKVPFCLSQEELEFY